MLLHYKLLKICLQTTEEILKKWDYFPMRLNRIIIFLVETESDSKLNSYQAVKIRFAIKQIQKMKA